MKKVLLSIIFMLTLIVSSNAQSNSFLARGGYSWLNGLIGAEYQINRIGLGLGWMPNQKPLSGEKVTSICYNLTFYGGEWDESVYYISIGGATNGFQLETQSSSGYYDYQSSAGFILMGGYKWSWDMIDLKGGLGYGWGLEMGSFTYEATLGFRLSKK